MTVPEPDDFDESVYDPMWGDCLHEDVELRPESDSAVCGGCGAETSYDAALAWLSLLEVAAGPVTEVAQLGPTGVAALGDASGVRLGSVHA